MLTYRQDAIVVLDQGPSGGGNYTGSDLLTLSVESPTEGTAANIYAGAAVLSLVVQSPTSGGALAFGGDYVGDVPLGIAVLSPTEGSPGFIYQGNVALQIGVASPTVQGPIARAFDASTANLNGYIADLVIEDDYDITRSIPGVPDGSFLSQAWFTLKESETDEDADAIIQKTITAIAQSGSGQISNVGLAGTAELFFELSALETSELLSDRVYFYDIQVLTNTNKLSTREKGMLIPNAQITDSV